MIRDNMIQYYPGIDLLKAFGLYLMILGHGSLVSTEFNTYIYSFHMPLFFMISGFLFKFRNISDTIRKGFRSLIIPYIILNAVCLILEIFILHLQGGDLTANAIINRFLPIILGLGYKYNELTPVCTPMWFFYSLFIVQVLASASRQLYKYGHILLFVISIVFAVILKTYKFDTLVPIDSSLVAYPFFFGGYILKQFTSTIDNSKVTKIVMVLLMVISLLMININERIDINTCDFGKSIILFYLIGGLISAALICNLKYCKAMWGAKLIATGSSIIVGLNLEVISIVRHFILTDSWHDTIGMLTGFIILMIFIPVIIFCNKYIPMVLGRSK